MQVFTTLAWTPKRAIGAHMQAAIIIDSLRCIAWLTQRGVSTARISLCGHSLGGAVSIVNAAMLKNVVGVAVGAPAVRMPCWKSHAP